MRRSNIAGAAVGITAVLATAALALSFVRYAIAAYLLVLGFRAWRQPSEYEAAAVLVDLVTASPRRAFKL